MPVYNAEAFVAEAIQSVLDQTLTDFELLIVDDGSTDGSLAVIESFDDPRIRIIRLPMNQGLRKASNVCLANATGKYMARMDGDDVAAPNRLSRQITYMEEHADVGVCGTFMEVFGSEGGIWRYSLDSERIKAELLFKQPLPNPTAVLRLDVLRRNGIRYHEDGPSGYEDWELLYALKDRTEFAILPEVLVRYRRGQDSATRYGHAQRQWQRALHRRVLQDLGIDASERDLECQLAFAGELPGQISREDLQQYRAWLSRLLSANGRLEVFPASAFRQVIDDAWRWLFYGLEARGWRGIVDYALVSRGLRAEHLKHLVKSCLLGRASRTAALPS